jgi:activating signal cointegrator 1
MFCLTVKQPYAQLLVLGIKRLETRLWNTQHRGRLLIHASRDDGSRRWVLETLSEPVRARLAQAGYRDWPDLPHGAIVGHARLEAVYSDYELRHYHPELITPEERSFGFFGQRTYAWVMSEPTPLAVPIPLRGNLGLWEAPPLPQLRGLALPVS